MKTAAAIEAISVHYEVVAQAAQDFCPERDFEPQSGTLTWAPVQREATISVVITDDNLAETDEAFMILDDNDRTQLIGGSHQCICQRRHPGVWVGSHPTGYAASGFLDAELEDVSLGTGGLELQLEGGSTFTARALNHGSSSGLVEQQRWFALVW